MNNTKRKTPGAFIGHQGRILRSRLALVSGQLPSIGGDEILREVPHLEFIHHGLEFLLFRQWDITRVILNQTVKPPHFFAPYGKGDISFAVVHAATNLRLITTT